MKKFPVNCGRQDERAVKLRDEVNVPAKNEIIHRASVRDDDHLVFGKEALARASSAQVLAGYGRRHVRNRSSAS